MTNSFVKSKTSPRLPLSSSTHASSFLPVSALTGRNDEAWVLLESGRRGLVLLFTNEFVIKEIRRTLREFRISQEKINYGIGYVMECCTVRKNRSKHELVKYDIE